ncbi:MAG: sulfurtransferase TusA family protein [Magnetococcales bacterium]|nr:sulfurtransferase TusA family protein [Magnetococcales bacterium]MBF0148505.1 sulfurtransferase TusA family protein [Magnetococcales bacterium]
MSDSILEIDARDLLCPMPIFKIDQAIMGVPLQGRVKLVATDPGIERDLPAWCAINGHVLVDLARKGRIWTAIVEKGS